LIVQSNPDGADRRFDPMLTGSNPAKVSQRHCKPDHSVPAHPKDIDIVEENHSRCAGRITGLAEERSHKNIRAARFGDDSPSKGFMLFSKSLGTLCQRSISKIRTAGEDNPRGFTSGV
jgi:hypothetical protein